MVWYADELDARTDLGLYTLHEQVEQRPVPHVLHHQAALSTPGSTQPSPRICCGFSGALDQPERGRSEQTCHRCNCQQVHS